MLKILIFLLFSQSAIAAEKNYIRVGENPVNPRLMLEGEKIFRLKDDILLTTIDGNGQKHTGWISNKYHLVGKYQYGNWQATRIYECGNPIIKPRIILQEHSTLRSRTPNCPLDGWDWFYWGVGPALIGYGAGNRENLPMGVGGGLIVIDITTTKRERCKILKKGLIGTAAAGIGWLIGNALYKPSPPKPQQSTNGSPGGPGPIPPNGLALRF